MRTIETEFYRGEDDIDLQIQEHVMAESPLETEVIRQAILADKWNLMPEHSMRIGINRNAHAERLISSGRQALFQPKFN